MTNKKRLQKIVWELEDVQADMVAGEELDLVHEAIRLLEKALMR